MSEEKKVETKSAPEEKKLELPSVDLLRDELAKEQYRHSYNRILRSTIFSLLVVAAVTVLLAGGRRRDRGRFAAAGPAHQRYVHDGDPQRRGHRSGRQRQPL